ncbi:adenosylcobinamide-GDP ribazoletransferase [Mesobacillus zeae]|uniref:Adenosylcobinamide-GDP ribazoletransferase n=1 Tax=Mesobacillus zeae TaxID=1917180 RepID=A0A398B6K9_9BACI|nr:adenosylcobinamide-GDP ribazoletransferase [Mesobacillus zeae]RID85739.1 adenosylcobinamide-GDP ribazoletransferase [Mesobacillus zeae]
MKWFKGFLINVQFFTSIPIPFALPMDREHLDRAMKTFPLLGLLLGGIVTSLLYIILVWTPLSPLAAAFLIWLAGIVLTGGIHLDGWIDCSDAFFSYQDRGKRLEIMKDPRTGAFGVLSVIIILAAKFLFIYEIILMIQPFSYVYILLLPFFSRMVMGVLLLRVPSAKNDGLGQMFKSSAGKGTLAIYGLYAGLFLAIAASFGQTLPFALILMVVCFLAVLYLKQKILSWFGGLTGDVLGASVEGTELLLWMTLWLLHYTVMG